MKKHYSTWLAVVLSTLILFSLPTVAFSFDNPALQAETTFVFPASLVEIKEEAFAWTAVRTVMLPQGFLAVQDLAFDHTYALSEIYVPATTFYIADTAFSLSGLQSLHGEEGSYAQQWAQSHNLRFELSDYWYTVPLNVYASLAVLLPVFSTVPLLPEKGENRIRHYLRCFCMSMRPQDRTELYPINYRFP